MNGDFETGDLTGYTAEKYGASGVAFDAFVNILNDNGNSYVEITTASWVLGLDTASITQSKTIDTQSALLTFDADFVSEEVDFVGGGSLFRDSVSFYFFDENFDFYRPYGFVSGGGAGIDPFGGTGADAFTTLTTATNSDFDTGVSVDLSGFMGQTLLFGLGAVSNNDASIVTARFDNLTFSALPSDSPAPVPLPATLPMILAALGLLAAYRVS